jgi:hypothetical protein
MIKRLLIITALVLIPALARAADPLLDQPRWSLEVKGGAFYPDIDNWEAFYGSKRTGHFAGSLAYKIFRYLEVGVEGGYSSDSGQGFALQHAVQTGKVKYEIAPLQAFILFRGVFTENQLLAPYAGGGWTRIFYRETVENQDVIRGSADGYHGRAGLQLLLDTIDASAANSFYMDFGVHHTYLFVEAEYIRAMTDDANGVSVNLGGTSYLAGFLFEF